MTTVAYMRVSTSGQDTASQEAKLREAGAKIFFSDSISGTTSADERPGLAEALRYVREGDELVVYSWSRLARNTRHLLTIVEDLDSRGISLRSVTEGVSTVGAVGMLLITVLSAVAELERSTILSRTADGRAAAMERGVKFGRKEKLTPTQKKLIRRTYAASLGHDSASAIARELGATYGVSSRTIFRVVAEGNAAVSA